jgi:glycosyltransferase involved in cell wall biosynthesis
MTRITVLFATRDGAHTLPRMLDTLERLASPSGGWNVIAVDNGSADNSRELLEQRTAKLPMTVLTEPRQGKNIALNRGLALVEGDIVALTDDDIILPADWLVSIESVAEQQSDYDIFGGVICPVWETLPPDWVLRCVPKDFLGLTDFPEGQIQPELIWGGSMAVRAAVIQKYKFNESFDMHCETEFTSRANRGGHRCWHFHRSPVGHIIRAYQLEPKWYLQRASRRGSADYRIFHITNKEILARRSLHPAATLLKGSCHVTMAACNCARSHLFGDADDRFKAALRLRYWRANFVERYAIVTRPASRKSSIEQPSRLS